MRLLVALALIISLLALGTALPVRAQYPVATTVSASVSNTAPEPGSSVSVVCTVQGSSGQPLAGQPCTFTVVSQPGGASFNGAASITVTTDASGTATAVLTTGSAPGTITVRLESAGAVSQATVSTAGAQALPRTGGAPVKDGGSSPLLPLLIVLGAFGAIAAGAAIRTLVTGRR